MSMTAFIPKTIKVGYQSRKDTYSGKLAYVIYYDEKNKLRKEESWNNWIDKNIDSNDFDNIPLDGFVLNKKTGDYSDWFHRQAYIRVYDPRGFEFEITVNNLLYILENCNCIKGKGLEGKFCYGWVGKELLLLPENSLSYNESKKYSDLIFNPVKIKKSELKVGNVYKMKSGNKVIYLGKYDNYFDHYRTYHLSKGYVVSRNKSIHCYLSASRIDDLNEENFNWRVNKSASFNPMEDCNETVEVSDMLKWLNRIVSYTGEARVNYTKKDLNDLINKDINSFKAMTEDGWMEFKTFIYSNTDILFVEYNKETPYGWSTHRESALENLPQEIDIYYNGIFVNGKLIEKKDELIYEKK